MGIKLVLTPEAQARVDAMTAAEKRQFLAAALEELMKPAQRGQPIDTTLRG